MTTPISLSYEPCLIREPSSVITSLKSQFARHGIPNVVRGDNGFQFSSSDFKTFAREWDFEHITSSPYHARSNGKVEKAVNTAKRILKKAVFDHKDPYLALLDWRNTPTEGLDSSPVQRLMGRRTRTLLPTSTRLLKPKLPKLAEDLVTKKREKQAYYYNKGAKLLKELKPGDILRNEARSKRSKEAGWKKGTCLKEVAPRSFEIDVEGTRYRRNWKDLTATQESPEIDNHAAELDEPRLTDDQFQRVTDPVQPGMPSPEDTAPERQEISQRAPEIAQPTRRRSTRGRLIRTPIPLKDYCQP